MNNHFYECAQDSDLGKKISDFWQKCIRCIDAKNDYAKKMGANYYVPDDRWFEGGVVALTFEDESRVDKSVWQLLAKYPKDGTGYYAPNVESRTGYAEIPHRDYALKDTFDRIYHRDRIIQNDGKLFIPYTEFFRDEPAGTRNDIKGGKQPRTASRGLRKAIKAEIQRRRLPVMTVQSLLAILGATIPEESASGKRREIPTPTFFPHRSRYFIGCAYPCSSPDLLEITPQQYKMNADKHELEERHKA